MIVSVGEVAARCRGCGGSDFIPAQAGEWQLASVFTCTGCAAACTYQELLDSIGEQAMRRANESLAELLKNRPARRKPRNK